MLSATLTGILSAATLLAGAPVGWRTDGTGRYPQANPPLEWSPSSNVVWMTRLPNFSNASPLILGDRLFVCTEPDTLVCVSLADGKILWEKANPLADVLPPEEAARARADREKARELEGKLKPLKQEAKQLDNQLKKDPESAQAKARQLDVKKEIGDLEESIKGVGKYADPAAHAVNGYSSATPATDGQNVYVLFGTGVVAGYDLEGRRLWGRFVEKPTQGWGNSASPLVVGKTLICHIVKLTALDLATGAVSWQTASKSAWGSPVLARTGDAELVVTASGDMIRAMDGKLLAGKVSGLDYCAPIVGQDLVYFVENGGRAVKLPSVSEGLLKPEVLWTTTPKKDRYYASPVYHDGLLYAVTQKGELSVIDANTGKVVTEKTLNLGGTFYPSITLAGAYIFVSSDAGKTVVFQPGPECKEIARNTLEPFRSSPVFVGDRMYVRAAKGLYCIGK
jgi:outer membrane protein assembly factor BamB